MSDPAPIVSNSLTPKHYAKRRRRKIIAWVSFGVSAVGIGVFAIIAFLGRYSGNFTIRLDNAKNALTMGTTLDESNNVTDQTTLLLAQGLTGASAMQADSLLADEELDSSVGGSKNNGVGVNDNYGSSATSGSESLSSKNSYTYFAYTFFLKNTSSEVINFSLSLTLDDPFTSTVGGSFSQSDKEMVLNILRVRFFENTVTSFTQTHNEVTYAKASTRAVTSTDGPGEEYISNPTQSKISREYNKGRATSFESDDYVFEDTTKSMAPYEARRYTLVMWLEGWDHDTDGKQPPQGASITFSLNFAVNGDETAAS